MRIVAAMVLAGCLACASAAPAAAQTSPPISSKDQSIEEYGREWRRARKLARACGAPKAYMSFLLHFEGAMIGMKADEQRKLGKSVRDDPTTYSLGFEDSFDTTEDACSRHQTALEPILNALGAVSEKRAKLQAFRAPLVACPASGPC